ncbi:MAG TPA: CpsD/CapB family tyrosine-protein kinase [Candidatus Aquilonibacter sp.]|nr:CpsD/CapB family tyrosine-protein kinase [Candidatus Aquilonibacter sp.]
MSRNFELLQQLGKEQEMLGVGAVAATFPSTEPEPRPSESFQATEPQLKLEPQEQEQLTKLVQRVFLTPGAEAPRVVVFTASEPGNGSSWICARAAETLAAQVSGTVCLIDANLKNPRLHEEFEVEIHEGFADALRGPVPIGNFARSLGRPNLRLVSCGAARETDLPSLGSERVRQKVRELRAQADYILMDAPAVTASPDVAVLGAVADGVVLVLRANSSRRETARQAVEDLHAANVRILGAVLNQRTFPIPEAIYQML